MQSFQANGPATFLRRHRARLRQAAAVLLVAASLVYVYRALADSMGRLDLSRHSLGTADLAMLVLGILGTLVLSTIYHVIAVDRVEKHAAPRPRVALAYALGQVMRYVPGKLFGILFQINFLSGQVRAASIGIALLVQTFYDYAWTFVLVACVLLAARFESPWPLAAMVPALEVVWWIHRGGYLERFLAQPRMLRRFLGEQHASLLSRPGHATAATAVLAAVWLPMLLGIGLGLSTSFGTLGAIVLGVLYVASAVLSLLVVVVPSGLVVREALFVWLGAQYGIEPATLVFIGLLLRVCLTACELLNLLVFAAVERIARKRTPSTAGKHDP